MRARPRCLPPQKDDHEPQALYHRARHPRRTPSWLRRIRLAREPLDGPLPGDAAVLVSLLGGRESEVDIECEAWVPRIRSARPPRRPRGEIATRWATGLTCAAIIVVLLIVG